MSSRVRLAHSVWPSDWGWKAVDITSLVPMVRNRLCQNLLVNLASWSEMIEVGRPWSRKTWSKNIFAVSGAVAVVRVQGEGAALEVDAPFLESVDDGEEFLFVGRVVAFSRVHLP